MASPKTKAIQAPIPSRFGRTMTVQATPLERLRAKTLTASLRPVLKGWVSSDGRAVYASDGISIRRVNR